MTTLLTWWQYVKILQLQNGLKSKRYEKTSYGLEGRAFTNKKAVCRITNGFHYVYFSDYCAVSVAAGAVVGKLGT